MADLRIRSRQDYLTKREAQKLEALGDDIKDEEYLFGEKPQTLANALPAPHTLDMR
eukprot:SAG11_NODE_1033_length_6095_cov_5.337725_2_plen_56_part_00